MPTATGSSGFGRSIRRARSRSTAPTAPAIRSGRRRARKWRSSPTIELKRIPIGGGGATVICEAGVGAGGTWNADGTIVFQPHQQGRADAGAGGRRPARAGHHARRRRRARRITCIRRSCPTAGTSSSTWPARSAGSTSASSDRASDRFCSIPIRRFRPEPRRRRACTPTSGHLLYVRDRVLMARPFDAASRTVTGEPIKIADTVDYNPPGQAAFAIARSGAGLSAAAAPGARLADVDRSRAANALSEVAASAGGVPAVVAVTRRPRRRRRAARRAGRVVGVDDRSGGGRHGARAGGILERVAGVERRRIGARLQHRRRLAAEHRRPRNRGTAAERRITKSADDAVRGCDSRRMRGPSCFARSRATPAGISSPSRPTAARRRSDCCKRRRTRAK